MTRSDHRPGIPGVGVPEGVKVAIDLFGFDFSLRLGLALLLAALAGAFAAGVLLTVLVLMPRSRKLRRLTIELKAAEAAQRNALQ